MSEFEFHASIEAESRHRVVAYDFVVVVSEVLQAEFEFQRPAVRYLYGLPDGHIQTVPVRHLPCGVEASCPDVPQCRDEPSPPVAPCADSSAVEGHLANVLYEAEAVGSFVHRLLPAVVRVNIEGQVTGFETEPGPEVYASGLDFAYVVRQPDVWVVG